MDRKLKYLYCQWLSIVFTFGLAYLVFWLAFKIGELVNQFFTEIN